MPHEFDEIWKRIDNALAFLSEHQVQHQLAIETHDKEMAELREMHKKLALAVIETGKQIQDMKADSTRFWEEMRTFKDEIIRYLKGNRPNGH
jgi:hypothetical protein